MLRRARIIMIILLLGAVVNVAVAWGCAVMAPQPRASADALAQIYNNEFWGYPERWPNEFDTKTLGFTRTEMKLGRDSRSSDGAWLSSYRVEAGFPMVVLSGTLHGRYHAQRILEGPHESMLAVSEAVVLPLHPVFPGFLINTLFYALLLWLLFCAPFALRRVLRRRRGLCGMCAYPVGASPVCTECGAVVMPHANTPAMSP